MRQAEGMPRPVVFLFSIEKREINRGKGKKVGWKLRLKKVPDGIMPPGVVRLVLPLLGRLRLAHW